MASRRVNEEQGARDSRRVDEEEEQRRADNKSARGKVRPPVGDGRRPPT
jgi:hypothetical protein